MSPQSQQQNLPLNTPTLHGCSTQKFYENSTNLSSLCVTCAKKNVSFFFFTLSHSHYVSLYLSGLHFLKLSLVFFSQWPNGSLLLQLFAVCFSLSHTLAKWLFLLSFLFFQHVQHTYDHFSLREVRLLTSLGHFSINEKSEFEDSWNKLINEL